MKKTLFACTLLALFAAPAGSARADSSDHRHGYWDHSHSQRRDRGEDAYGDWREGWREARRDGWSREQWKEWRRNRRGGGGGAENPDDEPVDQANDGHTGQDD